MKKVKSFDDIPESPIKNMVRDLLDEVSVRGVAGASALYKDMQKEYKLTVGESAALANYFQIAYAALPSSVALKKSRMKNPIYAQLIYCATCAKETPHHDSQHHSGEVLAQCKICGAWKPFRIPAGKTRGKNPVPPSIGAQKKKAQLLYESFTGHDAGEVEYIDKPIFPDAVSVIGDIDGVMYTTVRDGKVEKYIHKFKKNSRPLFCVAPDGLTLYMIGGSYQFGERGIVDK